MIYGKREEYKGLFLAVIGAGGAMLASWTPHVRQLSPTFCRATQVTYLITNASRPAGDQCDLLQESGNLARSPDVFEAKRVCIDTGLRRMDNGGIRGWLALTSRFGHLLTT